MPVYIENKKARLDYEIFQEFEAGMELFGTEVKALRGKKGSLVGARVIVRGGEAYLVGATFPPHQEANAPRDYDPKRNRRLLLTKKEILALSVRERERGFTIVPLSVYTSGRKLKLKLAVGRGRKKYDKREVIRKRETKRSIERVLKNADK
jgi:SsrA-binding protein